MKQSFKSINLGAGDNRLALWKIDTENYEKRSRSKSINSDNEDSFSSSPSKSILSVSKGGQTNANKLVMNSNRTTSLKRLFPSTSSTTSSSSSSYLTLPTSTARLSSFNTPYSPLYNVYNNNSTFSSSFFLTNSFNNTSSTFLRGARRTTFNPFYSFRNHLTQSQNRTDDVVNENYYLSTFLNRQINETNESNNRVQSDETNDVEIDEEDEDENDNDIITSVDTSNSSNFDLDWDLHNPVANDINEEDENNLIFNHSDSEEFDDSNDIDDDDEDEDEDDDNENFGFKRRRLNSIGKYKTSNGIKYNKPIKVTKCKQSKRIRALAFNLKRNEIAAISMNAAFHYFDIKRFEQVTFFFKLFSAKKKFKNFVFEKKYTKKLSPLKEISVWQLITTTLFMQ